MKKEFLKVEMMLPDYSHPDFQWGSLPGALVSLLQNARPKSCVKVSGFYDHKGDMKNWKVVRSVLSSQKVQDKLQYRFKTSLTDEGMTFYAVGVKHEWEKTK